MRADGDFHGYVAARWPALVRTVVLLGCPVEIAPDVVAAGLASCRRDWRLATEQGDVDVLAHGAVVDAWAERRHGSWWAGLPAGSSGPDLSDLDRLGPDVRAGLVLRRFADLDASQAEAVAGPQAGGPLPDTPDVAAVRALGESVPVYAAPTDDELRPPRPPWWRRRGVLTTAGVVTLALVLGGWAVVSNQPVEPTQDEGVGLDRVEPNRSDNPAAVAWYAEDVLHLEHATYVLPTLRDLAAMGAGAVYGDVDGRVVHLADDGTRTLLGTKVPTARFAASEQLGWVAWVDPAGANPRLLVYDVGQAAIIGELDLPASRSGPQEEPDTHPVAIDQQGVYYVTSEGARAWRPTRDPGFIESIEPATLLDMASSNRVSQIGTEVIAVDRPFVVEPVTMPGRGAELSDDGLFVLTHDPSDGELRIYDASTGGLVGVELPALQVVDAVLAPEGAITYITIDPDGFASQEGVNDSNPIRGELVTCRLDDGSCEALATIVLDSEAPILGR